MVSRYNGMRFCDSSASKSDASMWCLYQFVFAMYFVPQRRAFFPHLNFQKCSGPGVLWAFWLRNVLRAKMSRALFQHLNVQKCSGPGLFLTFWLQNVLRATAASNFWFLIRPDGSALAALASLLFELSEPQSIGKTRHFATFLPFRVPCLSFCWLFLFSDLLSYCFLFYCNSSCLWCFISTYCWKFDV